MRYAILGIVCLACGCGPTPTATVEARQLVVAYRDSADEPRYTGRTIRVNLPADGYSITPTSIGWHAATDVPPAVVFVCTPPPDTRRAIEVVGTCRGKIPNGVHRGFGVNWYIQVTECTWTFAP